MSPSKRKSERSPGDLIAEKLGLDLTIWKVGVGYGKGFLSGARYAFVSLTHLPSGRTQEREIQTSGKAKARRDAEEAVRDMVREMGQS